MVSGCARGAIHLGATAPCILFCCKACANAGARYRYRIRWMLYHAYQAQRDLAWPLKASARAARPLFDYPRPVVRAESPARAAAAARALFDLVQLTHCRPAFAIDSVTVGDRRVKV